LQNPILAPTFLLEEPEKNLSPTIYVKIIFILPKKKKYFKIYIINNSSIIFKFTNQVINNIKFF
jgi:hypothetical protein